MAKHRCDTLKDLLATTKALADAQRVRALCAVATRELCVCQIIELLGLAPSTVSRHMAVLQQAGLVASRKEGRWIYYRLPEAGGPSCAAAARAWVRGCLRTDAAIRADRKRLARILRMDRTALCRRRK